ncbi:MAG: fibronectin type III domain-containing protein, partial [Chloroflexota bacterium]
DPTMGELEALAMLDSGGLPGTDGREAAAATKGIACVGDGTGGNRVQAIYAVPAGRKDRYTKVAPSIRHWAADIDIVFRKSAAVTGGTRRVRWVTAAGCVLSVMRVKVSANAIDLGVLAEELAAKGFNQVDRKYLVWLDETDPYGMMCGWGESPQDDDPGPANGANGAPFAFRGETRSGLTMSVGSYAEIYADCWGQSASMGSTEAHELAHMLGAVQSGSPNSDGGGHVTDGYDLMTTDGQLGGTGRARCKKAGWVLLDCRNDDYFSTSPKAGSYLATHWNVADSSFLTGTDAGAPVVSPPSADPGWARDDGSVTTTVTWTAIDDRAVLADALEVSTDGGPYVAVAIPMRGDDYRADHTAAEVNQDVPLLPGHTYTVRVRAMDTAGTWSTWAESSPFIVDGAS